MGHLQKGNRGLRGDRGFVLELFVCALSRSAGLRASSFDYAQDFGCWLERPQPPQLRQSGTDSFFCLPTAEAVGFLLPPRGVGLGNL